MRQLEGKVAIVTGAASGIGRAIARAFAAKGANVIIAGVTEDPREGGERTLELIRQDGGHARFKQTDVTKWPDVEAAVQLAVGEYGRLDVMVNNAAIGIGKPLLDTSEAEWDSVMAINLKGVFFGCKAAVQQMLTVKS